MCGLAMGVQGYMAPSGGNRGAWRCVWRRTCAGGAIEEDAFCVLDVHRLSDVRRRGTRRKGAAEDLRKLPVEAADAELGDVKVALEQALDAVLALHLEERLPGLKRHVGLGCELCGRAVGVAAGRDCNDLHRSGWTVWPQRDRRQAAERCAAVEDVPGGG